MNLDSRPVVVVLEDSQPLRTALCSALSNEGYEVRAPEDPRAWKQEAGIRPDVVVMDLAGYSGDLARPLVEAFSEARIVAIEPPVEVRASVEPIGFPFSLSALMGALGPGPGVAH